MISIASWNVNGIRAAEGKGLFQWMQNQSADVVCLQETKISADQLTENYTAQAGYTAYFQSAQRKGYSGVAVYTKIQPLLVSTLGIKEFDDEGRTLVVEYPGFVLINAYFPNSQEEGARLQYKLDFCSAVQEFCVKLVESGKHVVICGDFNIAHTPIDLANPKANEKNPGYLPEERAWMDAFISSGFVDTFRMFCKDPGNYTWWTYRFNARAKNIGWRIDYFFVDEGFKNHVVSSRILSAVTGSDHCPVLLEIEQ